MRFLNWILGSLLFLALLGFAVKNDQPVSLHYFFGYEWKSSLVNVLLLFFTIGALVGVVSVLGNLLQQRREIARLERELRTKSKLAGINDV